MPSYEAQATLPQYFPLKARVSVDEQAAAERLPHSPEAQRFPNYAPDAAPPLFAADDWVIYESHMNPAVCRGNSLIEDCMIDRFFVPVEAKW